MVQTTPKNHVGILNKGQKKQGLINLKPSGRYFGDVFPLPKNGAMARSQLPNLFVWIPTKRAPEIFDQVPGVPGDAPAPPYWKSTPATNLKGPPNATKLPKKPMGLQRIAKWLTMTPMSLCLVTLTCACVCICMCIYIYIIYIYIYHIYISYIYIIYIYIYI